MSFLSNLRNAKPVQPHPSVPAPITFFNLDLRTVVLVLLGIGILFKIIDIISLFAIIILVYPIIWIVIGIIAFLFQLFGFYAIYKLIPEYIVVYAFAAIFFQVLTLIQIIIYFSGGSIASFIFSTLFFVLFLYCLRAIYNYALACREAAGGVSGVNMGAGRV
ncbi:hypothetical protein HK098_007838 [Nowakowskiella sp. JEL0407]|nr:hypothetical protein HK098_007838 [Nowakowskiella sp. JEL0407]